MKLRTASEIRLQHKVLNLTNQLAERDELLQEAERFMFNSHKILANKIRKVIGEGKSD